MKNSTLHILVCFENKSKRIYNNRFPLTIRGNDGSIASMNLFLKWLLVIQSYPRFFSEGMRIRWNEKGRTKKYAGNYYR